MVKRSQLHSKNTPVAENPLVMSRKPRAKQTLATSSFMALPFWVSVGLVIFSIAWVLAYDHLPLKRQSVVPNDLGQFDLYADKNHGGKNTASWLLTDTGVGWACDIREVHPNAYCGFHVEFSEDGTLGGDLSGFESIRLKLNYTGRADRLRLFLKNYNPVYADLNDYGSLKMNLVSLRVSELEEEISINFRELMVPIWWTVQYDVSREHAVPEYTNVVYLGVQTADPVVAGRHEVKIETIELIGRWVSREQWYLSILCLWLLSVSLLGVRHFLRMRRRVAKDKEIIGEMFRVNKYLREETDKYKELSTVDRLTGSLNRLGFERIYDALVAENAGLGGHALIVTDVDHFKSINDKFGHAVGDVILQKVAGIIMSNTRQLDSVCRWGGEEFVILCPSTSRLNAFKLAEKIRVIIESVVFSQEHDVRVTASFGVGVIGAAESFSSAFSRADEALYDAKENGRNCTVVAVEDVVDG